MERKAHRPRDARFRLLFLFALLVLAAACGEAVDGAGSSSEAGGGRPEAGGGGDAEAGAGDSGTRAPKKTIARFVTTTAEENGSYASDAFIAILGPSTASTTRCPGAIGEAGACCLFPPPRPPPTPVPGMGGSPPPAESAGTLTVGDMTTHASIATYPYEKGTYAIPPSYPAGTWSAGDALTVSGTGGPQIGAFALTAPALVPPFSFLPTAIAAGHDLTVSWTPEPDAQTMSISLSTDSGAIIACDVPEAAGKVTIDESLLPAARQTTCEISAARETDRYAKTPEGWVELESVGYASNRCAWE